MHLHLHTQYSVIDGMGQIKDYVELAKADGQEALAITDHGTLGGIIEGYLACKKAGIKFIAGQELYVDAVELREKHYPGHLTILAKNEEGYRALIAANNMAHRQFYYRPRITIQQIIENKFAENWIILSGCQSSPIYNWPQSDAEIIVKTLRDNCAAMFLEFMWHYSSDEQYQAKQNIYLERVAGLHRATGIPMVITNDCHYAHAHHEEIHQSMLRQSREASDLEFDGEGFHFKTIAQMQEIASSLGVNDAVDNAIEITKMCNLVIPEADQVNWYVPDITNGRPKETIQALCNPALEALEKKYPERAAEYRQRYDHELATLATSPAILNSYLVTHDVVTWCGNRNITVAARGSMAGSLVSYLLGITKEDPVKYRLSFSRAVNPARPTIPDFDLDVSSSHRGEVLDYLKQRYDGNIPIAAYTHFGPKGALRKVLKMEGLRDFMDIQTMTKPLPDDWSDGDFEYSPTSKRYVGKAPWFNEVPEQYQSFVAVYKGLYSTMSVHPSGLLVSGPERPIENEVPLQWIASSHMLSSAFDMYTLKKTGLFKLDVLGLRTLDQLEYMEKITHETVPDDNYDEPEVLAAFGADLLAEIFQMDGYACREVIKSIGGIRSFEDIVAANTLARPGCAQFTPYYRSGYTNLITEYPSLEPVLGVTNGLILYQEQVMEIARVLADFDDAEQDDVKEAIKYFRHEVWRDTIEVLFKERCNAKGINSDNILEAIARMASYTFNRAHALTYAAIAYKMMWYKIHHPAAYYAAVYDGSGDKQRLILESHFFGVKWRPADINRSMSDTIIDGDEILLGLSAIKGVGPSAFEAIARVRPFESFEDFMSKVEKRRCNKLVVDKLKTAFAFESLGIPGTFTAFREAFGFPYQFLDTKAVNKFKGLSGPNAVAGFITNIRTFTIQKSGPNYGKEMAQVQVANASGSKRCVVFPEIWHKAKSKLYSGAPICLEGYFQTSGDFIVESGYGIE